MCKTVARKLQKKARIGQLQVKYLVLRSLSLLSLSAWRAVPTEPFAAVVEKGDQGSGVILHFLFMK